jgi:p-cumate 2,3-dioxygenase alpha subunit
MDIAGFIVDRPDAGLFRINRSVMTSPEVFELERKRVFDRCWLYVGHESEIENPGDYRRRTVAGRPLFFVRGSDGEVRVFYNTCTHRGAMVCRHDEGQAQIFQCFYHAWTFSNKGELLNVPDESGYGGEFDKQERALKSPPRVDQYRGFYFVSFNPVVDDLKTYLGDARELIDLTMDSAEALGGWTILRGTAKYSIKANWKLLVENSMDGYHLTPVHKTFLDYMAWRRSLVGATQSSPPGSVSRSFALPNGHGGMLHVAPGRGIANPSPIWKEDVNLEVQRIKSENITRFGEQRGRQMSEVSRHLLIFPNLAFQDSHTGFRLRQIWPVAPDLIDVIQWDFVPRNEREDLRASRMEGSLAFLGPGGLATPDDVEALESCQLGFAADGVEWSDISRGMQREPKMTDELQMRAFWRQWHALMQERSTAGSTDDRQRPDPIFLDLQDA